MFGRQLKDLILSGERIIAAISFNQGTRKVQVRDCHIGWYPEKRDANLDIIANNSRYPNKNKIQTLQKKAA